MIDKVNQIINAGIEKKLLQQSTQNESIIDANIQLEGGNLLNFGSCSYLGLEFEPSLKEGVIDATRRFGTQFSSSRTYVSIGLYRELEDLLEEMFEKPVIAAASTTLGTLATLPVIIQEGDAVIMDFLVHATVQLAAQVLKAKKIPIHYIPHNAMDHLEAKIKILRGSHDRIWYLADGVYSMHGDFAPVKKIEALLNEYKQLHLFIDDAHGMSWTGKNGSGYVRSQIAHHEKMVLTTSLNKSMAAAGGAVVFPNESMKRDVMNCGGTLVFSGPIQPPMLGAAIASAKVHLAPDFPQRQAALKKRITYTNDRLKELGVPQYCVNDSPLFFIPCGLPKISGAVIERMIAKGFYMNTAGFPAVPMKKSGVRFTITYNHSLDDINQMLSHFQKQWVLGLHEEGSDFKEVAKIFKLEPIAIDVPTTEKVEENATLIGSLHTSIREISPEEWDRYFRDRGNLQHRNLLQLEGLFANNTSEEDNWKVYYYVVRDAQKQVILISHFSSSLAMDDMLAHAEVSEIVKEKRALNPYYLTSKTVMSGSFLTKGEAVVINYDHEDWKVAMKMLVVEMQNVAEEENASQILVREFDYVQKERLREHMLDIGLVENKLPDNFVVDNLAWDSIDEYLAGMGQRYRYVLRKKGLAMLDQFTVKTDKDISESERQFLYQMYREVHSRAKNISVFALPYPVIEMMFEDDDYDILRIYLKDNPEQPVAVMYSYVNEGSYNTIVVGLDYEKVHSHHAYKQALLQTVLRAKDLGCSRIDLGYTADLEKKRVGAKRQESFSYVMAMEHYSYAVLETIN